MHALVIYDVRPCPVQSGRLVGAVEINEEVIFGSHLGSTPVEIHHRLVIPVHEIHLETLHSHLGIMTADILHVPVESQIAGPEDDAHTALLSILAKHRDVNLRNHLHKVGLLVHSPALIEDDILDTVGGSKINVVFVGLVVDSGTEIHTIEIPVIPPVPGNLSRTHPAEISGRVSRSSKIPYKVIDSHLGIIGGNHNYPPRESLFS